MKTSKLYYLTPRNGAPQLNDTEIQTSAKFPHLRYRVPPRLVYHYTSLANSKLIINGGTLKFSAPETFNDPFDMHIGLIDFTCSNRKIKEYINRNFRYGPNSVRESEKKRATAEGPEAFSKKVIEGFNKRKKESGVCCFSRDSDVGLMWSHYADRHAGVCLGFDFEPVVTFPITIGRAFNLQEVKYIDQIKKVNCITHSEESYDHYVLSKSSAWKYEKEIRGFIYDRQDCDLFPFRKACLKEIYFGCRTGQQQIDEVLTLLNSNGYTLEKTQKMEMDDAIFNVKAVDL